MAEESSPRPPSKRKLGVRKLKLPRPKMLDWRTHDLLSVDHGGDDTLIVELLTYQRNLDELLKHKGQYVLIKGDAIVGIYSTQLEGLDAAVERFGEQPTLVMQIVEKEPIYALGYGIS